MILAEQAVRDACPPTWELEQWDLFVGLLQAWWPEPEDRWTEQRIVGLAMGMADFTADQAGAALKRLRNAGQKFPPRVPEIANAIHVDRDAPSWTEAYALLFDRPGGVIHARIPRGERPVGEDARWALREQAMLDRATELHPMIAAFTAAYGPRRLEAVSGRIAYGRDQGDDDRDFGPVELERLRQEWEDFVERADARRREGMPLLTPPLARRELAGPRRLKPLELLGRAVGPESAPTSGGVS